MPKVVDHEAYRAELLERCVDAFARHGYAALTMRKIASELGVSTGTLYHYFDSKEALFAGVVELVSRRNVDEAFPRERALPEAPAERFDVLVEFVREREAWLMRQTLVLLEYARGLGAQATHDDPALSRASQMYVMAVMQLLSLSEEDARLVLVTLDGLLLQRFFHGPAIGIDAVTGALRRALFERGER